MDLRTKLLNLKDEIACTGCGQCCPSICPHKQGKLCGIHPTVKGIEDRDYVCTITPVELVVYLGVACPPVGAKMAEMTGVALKELSRSCSTKRYDSAKLKQLLSQEV